MDMWNEESQGRCEEQLLPISEEKEDSRAVARTRATRAQASIIRDTLIEQSDRDISVSVFREAV